MNGRAHGAAGAGDMRRPPISPYLAEFLGVAIMLAVGLSAVSVDFGSGSPVVRLVPDAALRRLLTGSIFAGTATLVVYSVLGRISGGHLNPAMTLAFAALGKVRPRTAIGYAAAQVGGALVGATAVRLAWGSLAASVDVGATVPGTPGTTGTIAALAAEAVMTFALVSLVLQLTGRPRLAHLTPLAAGALVALLVTIEAPISGTSLNPARSLGPAVVAGVYRDLWLYLVAPSAAGLAAVAAFRAAGRVSIPCAKLFHTNEFACHFAACEYQRGVGGVGLGRDEQTAARTEEAIA